MGVVTDGSYLIDHIELKVEEDYGREEATFDIVLCMRTAQLTRIDFLSLIRFFIHIAYCLIYFIRDHFRGFFGFEVPGIVESGIIILPTQFQTTFELGRAAPHRHVPHHHH